jgi:BolA protein
MSRKDRLYRLLEEAFQPEELDVSDESHLHQGHAGWTEGGQTHYRVTMTASRLKGLSRVEQHRAVNEAVKSEFESGLHALALKLQA